MIILNSVAIWERGVEWVKNKAGFTEVHLYLDNDKAGIETVDRIRKHFSNTDLQNKNHITNTDSEPPKTENANYFVNIKIVDKSSIYKGFKDFGEWWESEK